MHVLELGLIGGKITPHTKPTTFLLRFLLLPSAPLPSNGAPCSGTLGVALLRAISRTVKTHRCVGSCSHGDNDLNLLCISLGLFDLRLFRRLKIGWQSETEWINLMFFVASVLPQILRFPKLGPFGARHSVRHLFIRFKPHLCLWPVAPCWRRR